MPQALKKLVMFSMYFWPTHPGYGTRYPYLLARAMKQIGWEVVVICMTPVLPSGRRTTGFKIYREVIEGMLVYRIPLPSWRHFMIPRRVLIYSWFVLIGSVLLTFLSRGARAIMALSPDVPFLLPLAITNSVILRKRLVISVTDLIPHILYELSIVKSRAAKFILDAVCLANYRLAYVLAITDELRRHLINFGLKPDKVAVAPLPVDISLSLPSAPVEPYPDIMLKDQKFVVLYSGIFGQLYDFSTLIEAAALLQKDGYNDIIFVIRGNGERLYEIISLIRQYNLRNCIVRRASPGLDDYLKYLSMASLCVVPLINNYIANLTLPSKTLEFWASGKPVLATSNGHLKRVIQKSNAGECVQPGNPALLANAILKLYNNRGLLVMMAKNGKLLVQSNYMPARVASLVERLLLECFK